MEKLKKIFEKIDKTALGELDFTRELPCVGEIINHVDKSHGKIFHDKEGNKTFYEQYDGYYIITSAWEGLHDVNEFIYFIKHYDLNQ